ncbi:MAG: glycerate kinase [Burkholderiaceae bacterium]|nr:glycerate kinase [Burkholderiaceae bacterium]
MDPRALLIESFEAAVAAADPARVLAALLPDHREIAGYRRTLVVGAGKAAASMAAALEAHWPAEASLEGLVVTRYGHGLDCRRIDVIEAGHPVPDSAGEEAARTILERCSQLGAADLLVVLVSGGASSLLALPVDAVAMADLKALTQALLASGAPIQDMNVVRKHLSMIQGGRLAQATRARVLALVISDVAGDDISAIGSGPCAPDPSTYQDALAVLRRYRVDPPASIAEHLRRGAAGAIGETPKPGDAFFARVDNRVIASAAASLAAAAQCFAAAGVRPVVLGDTITGEARDVAQVHAAIAAELDIRGECSFGPGFRRPLALISGGECTVTIGEGGGRGGRCCEFLLALAVAAPEQGLWAIAADTDGIDGSETNAGAVLTPDARQRARLKGVEAGRCLEAHDSYSFFESTGDLLVTGPTRTNVNDYRALLLP